MSRSAISPDWFLPEWLAYYDKSAADLGRLTGWNKSKISMLVTGKQDYRRGQVNEIARALNIHPFELLMHPDDAMAIRRLRDTAVQIAADNSTRFRAAG